MPPWPLAVDEPGPACMLDASVATTHHNPDGSVTVTLAASITSEEWNAAVTEIQALYPRRYAQWHMDAQGRDVFEVESVKYESPACGLCDAGQPHGHSLAGGRIPEAALPDAPCLYCGEQSCGRDHNYDLQAT